MIAFRIFLIGSIFLTFIKYSDTVSGGGGPGGPGGGGSSGGGGGGGGGGGTFSVSMVPGGGTLGMVPPDSGTDGMVPPDSGGSTIGPVTPDSGTTTIAPVVSEAIVIVQAEGCCEIEGMVIICGANVSSPPIMEPVDMVPAEGCCAAEEMVVLCGANIDTSVDELVSPDNGNTITGPSSVEQSVAVDVTGDLLALGLDSMKDLYGDLLDSYDRRIRPRIDQDKSVYVGSYFVLLNIIEFNTQRQKFAVLGYFMFAWYDNLLQWDPSQYKGTNTIRIPVKEIWLPRIVFLKAYDGDGIIGEFSADIAKVSSTGYVQWVPDGIYSVVCEVDISYFPFDVQECLFSYYVAHETVTTVDLHYYAGLDMNEFTENSEWDLINSSRSTILKNGNSYVDLRYQMKRRGSFVMFTVIAPLLMLSFLNGCVFLVPINSGEKGSFAITVFLSYGIFVTIVMDTLPHNSLQVSYFVLFIVALLSISVLLVLYAIIQSKVCNVLGDSVCRIGCLKKKSEELGNNYTWSVFMERLDVILFFVFLFLVASCSGVFMTVVYYRI